MRFSPCKTLIISALILFSVNHAEAGLIIRATPYFELRNGLVGYWQFNESTGSIAADSSGNSYTGNLIGGPVWTRGKIAGALMFDGANDVVSISSDVLNTPSALTFSAWVNPSRLVNTEAYFLISNRTSGNNGWSISISSPVGNPPTARISFTIQSVFQYEIVGSTPVTKDEWQYLSVVYNGSQVSFYRNRIFIESQNTGSMTTGTAMVIGAQGPTPGLASTFFQGSMDEARIYNRALSAGEITRLYRIGATLHVNTQINNDSLKNGLVGWWTFDGADVRGTVAYDKSGQNNNGALTNGPAPTFGKLGQALNFDGTDDYVDIGVSSVGNLLNGAQKVTITGWFNYNSLVAGQFDNRIFVSWIDNNNNFYINVRGDNNSLAIGGRSQQADSFQSVTYSRAVAAGGWHQFVGIYDYAADTIRSAWTALLIPLGPLLLVQILILILLMDFQMGLVAVLELNLISKA